VIEVHGTLWEVECLGPCHARFPMSDVLRRVAAGEADPPCESCGGLLKSATISFGQALNPVVLEAAYDAARAAKTFLAIGTSLTVQPAAGLAAIASDHGAKLVILNAEPTPYDDLADVVLRAPIGDVLPRLVG
jgi:NAD-dependent deacetylase